MIYISSNDLLAKPRAELRRLKNVISWDDISSKLTDKFMEFTYLGGVDKNETRIDPIVTAMFDSKLATRARNYLGIRHSDYSQIISEHRLLEGKETLWYQ
jgi:hypothetical protein